MVLICWISWSQELRKDFHDAQLSRFLTIYIFRHWGLGEHLRANDSLVSLTTTSYAQHVICKSDEHWPEYLNSQLVILSFIFRSVLVGFTRPLHPLFLEIFWDIGLSSSSSSSSVHHQIIIITIVSVCTVILCCHLFFHAINIYNLIIS